MSSRICVAALLLAGVTDTQAVAQAKVSHFHYIPGMSLVDYQLNDLVNVSVNSLHSHDALVSYDFYSLPFCKPSNMEDVYEANYGQILWGDRIQGSYYQLNMKTPSKCMQVPCTDAQRVVKKEDLQTFEKRINNGYRGNFVVDNLPVVNPGRFFFNNSEACYDGHPRGWPLGVPKRCAAGKTLIHNHLAFNITVNKHVDERYIIVSVKVMPHSIDWDQYGIGKCGETLDVMSRDIPFLTTDGERKNIHWTYSVVWHETKAIDWSNRWDEYLLLAFSNSSTKTHWASIINSLLIVLCLSAIVAIILLRTLHIDFNRYNNSENEDETSEEMGWKLVHADVFRPPDHVGLFSAFIGTGVQLIGMFCLSIFFAVLGLLSPANRGGLITAAMFLFVLMSIANGAVTGLMLNMFKERRWKVVFLSGLLYPGVLFALWLSMEAYIQVSRQGANTAPIYAILEIMALWFGVSLPLVVLGAGFGFKFPDIEPITSVAKLPRKIPPQRWYLELPVLVLAPGLIPFGAAFVELRFILFSMWQGMVYYVFGFLAISAITVGVAAAEVAVVMIYFLLVFEDHRWWWRSVFIPGGMGIWFFAYSIFYYNNYLQLKTTLAAFIYFEVMAALSVSIFISIGTIGFISSLIFIRAIYSRIKID
eukprot:TRINITY_DN2423_c0_g1_i1.p1 TRINITY_DN2423_c0_g1~~TRINITY_DN2423_c0_g1_i1.p1  ORF type:complete len:646 (+),score=281.25 TRINITY_DN2423_c0_g1_i1:142-2079(+)